MVSAESGIQRKGDKERRKGEMTNSEGWGPGEGAVIPLRCNFSLNDETNSELGSCWIALEVRLCVYLLSSGVTLSFEELHLTLCRSLSPPASAPISCATTTSVSLTKTTTDDCFSWIWKNTRCSRHRAAGRKHPPVSLQLVSAWFYLSNPCQCDSDFP